MTTRAPAPTMVRWPSNGWSSREREPEVGQLDGKVVLISGGASDIGRGTATRLAAEGASVAIGDVTSEGAEAVAAEVVERGGSAFGAGCDVREEESVAAFVDAAVDRFGG